MGPVITQAWQFLQPFVTAIGAVVLTAGAITGFAWWVFKTYSEKWLDKRFETQLLDYKHKHELELQRLRLQIDTLLDRTIKLHGKEFDTLPEAWSLLNDAFGWAVSTSLGAMQYADLRHMNAAELSEFLESEDLPKHKKDEINSASDKNKVYSEALQWRALRKSEKLRIEFHSFILKNGIFFPNPIRTQFLEINQMMISALAEREMGLTHPDYATGFKEAQKLHGEGRTLVEKLQGEIHDRLWNSQTKADTQ